MCTAPSTWVAPGLLPGRVPLSAGCDAFDQVPTEVGMNTIAMLEAAASGDLDVLVLLGADPLSDFPDSGLAARALESVGTVIAIESLPNASTVAHADVVLPAAMATEVDGTFTNLEGRVSVCEQKVTPPGTARADWMIATELAARLGADLGVESPESIRAEIAAVSPVHCCSSPKPRWPMAVSRASWSVARRSKPHRFGLDHPGQRRLLPAPRRRSPHVRQRHDAAGQRLQRRPRRLGEGHAQPADFEKLGLDAGTVVKVISGRGELMAPLAADFGVPAGSAMMPARRGQRQHPDRCVGVGHRRSGGTRMMFAQDPLYAGDWLGDALITGLKVLVAFAFLLVAVMLNIWFLRKVISDFQNRIGPNTAGRWGILQSLADGIKLFFKEDLIPDNSDRFAFKLAPYLSLVPAFLVFAIIPIGGGFNDEDGDGVVTIFGHDTFLQVADPPVGVLWFLAMSSLAIYGIMLAGWSSGSKYPLIGSVRASAQMVSYEAALGLALASVLVVSGTLSTHAMVLDQSGTGPCILRNREHPSGLVPPAGRHRALRRLHHRRHGRTQPSAVRPRRSRTGDRRRLPHRVLLDPVRTLLPRRVHEPDHDGRPARHALPRRPQRPGVLLPEGWWIGVFWFFVKLMGFLFLLVWVRATLPRFRYDQLMDFGWKLLIPLSLGWFILLAFIQIGRDEDWSTAQFVGLGVGLAAVFVASPAC